MVTYTWTHEYNGSVKPDSDGFTLTGTDIANVREYLVDSWLQILDDASVTQCQYDATNSTDTAWNPGEGWTIAFFIQVVAGTFTVLIDDGTYRETFTATNAQLQLKATTSAQVMTRPRWVRITGSGSAWKVYIDEDNTPVIETTAATATTSDLLRWGCYTASSNVFVRQLVFSTVGAYLPSTFAVPSLITTYCDVRDVRDYTDIPSDALSDSAIARIIRNVEMDIDYSVVGSEFSRASRIFASGTATSEMMDIQGDELFVYTRYKPITAITAFQRRSGTSTWSDVSNNDTSGYYCSEADMRMGRIRAYTLSTKDADAFCVSYTWGYDSVPEEVKRLATLMASLDCYNAALQHGAQDVFAQRRESLKDEITLLRSRIQGMMPTGR